MCRADPRQMDFCVDEWKFGRHEPQDLNITDMQKRYLHQKKGLAALARTAFGRLEDIKEAIFNYGM
jgi:hypothetical protein